MLPLRSEDREESVLRTHLSNTWELIKLGNFEEACRTADKEFADKPSTLTLGNKVLALLGMSHLDEAIELSKRIIHEKEGSTDTDFIFLGIAQWLQNKLDQAIETWEKATNTKYTDAAGGVEIHALLFFASVMRKDERLKNRSMKKLQSLSKHGEAVNWPGPIAVFLLGKINEEGLRSKLSAQPLLREKQLCQAAFYIGLMKHLNGDENGFIQSLEESCGQGGVTRAKPEYYLAKFLLSEFDSESLDLSHTT